MKQFLFLCIFVGLASCSSGGASPGSAGGAGGSAASGGSAGSAGSDAGGGAGASGAAPFAAELCNDHFCWEEPKPFAGRINALAASGTSVWLAGEGMLARRVGGVWSVAPAPDSAALNDVFAFSDSDVWAVGAQGAIVHFDGSSVTKVASPTTAGLHGIWGASSDDIWAVGEAGTILHWDGVAWSPASGGYDELHAVWGTGPNDVYAVGGTLNVGTVLHFDGSSWTSTSSGLSGAGLYSVSGVGADVFAGGEYGHLYRIGPGATMQWLGGGGGRITDVVAVGANEAWAVAESTLLYWNGTELLGIEQIGGFSLLPDPEQNRLLIAGNGVSTFADGVVTTEIAAPYIEKLWMGDAGPIALTESGEVVHRAATGSGSWSVIEGIQGGVYSLYVGGLEDGTRVIVDSGSTAQVLLFDGSSTQTLPAVDDDRLYSPVIAGTSPNDFWIVNGYGPTRFGGGSWQLETWPSIGANVHFSPAGSLVLAPNDVWVVGGTDSSSGSHGAGVAHYDGLGWTLVLAGDPATTFTSVARFGTKLYAAGGYTDYSKPKEAGFVYYPQEPVLYENAGAGWSKVTIAGISGDYEGSPSALVGASGSELFFALQHPHPGVANLLVYDGQSFSERPYPATIASQLFVSAEGTLRLLAGNGPYGILRSR